MHNHKSHIHIDYKTVYKLDSQDNECLNCGVQCHEQHDYCSPRCARSAKGGFEQRSKKSGWDG